MDPSYLGRPIPAPVAQKRSGPPLRPIIFIALLVIAIIVGAAMLFASGDNTGELRQRLSARQATTLKIIADGQKNLSSQDLKKLNSELNLILIGDTSTLESSLKAAGMKKVDKDITAMEADAPTFTKLRDAKLNAEYDTTYRNVLIQKLESLRALVREFYDASNSKALKAVLSTEYTHLTTYLTTLETL